MKQLHIIEPTLSNQAGHCHGYIHSLLKANKEKKRFKFKIWHNHQGRKLFENDCQSVAFFNRSIRKVQLFFCGLYLMLGKGIIFIPTSGRVEIIVLHILSKLIHYKRPIFLHFHQVHFSNAKKRCLKTIAKKADNLQIISTTLALKQEFMELGFKNCYQVNCPSYLPNHQENVVNFSHVLYAGAMRMDKGFPLAVDLVAHMHGSQVPFHLQCSASPMGKIDAACQKALIKLNAFEDKYLKKTFNTLDNQQYLQEFSGAITLLLYDTKEYANKFSGVSLDSICHGAPVITFKGTSISQTIEHYQAGIVLEKRDLKSIETAILRIKDNYEEFQKACFKAAKELKILHHPARTLELIDALSS